MHIKNLNVDLLDSSKLFDSLLAVHDTMGLKSLKVVFVHYAIIGYGVSKPGIQN